MPWYLTGPTVIAAVSWLTATEVIGRRHAGRTAWNLS